MVSRITVQWNPVEHRLFSYISTNCLGKPLKTLEIMLGYIRGTSTATGLKVEQFLESRGSVSALSAMRLY
jgi:hypothetical protein